MQLSVFSITVPHAPQVFAPKVCPHYWYFASQFLPGVRIYGGITLGAGICLGTIFVILNFITITHWEKLLDSDWLKDCELICNLRANSVIQGKLQILREKIYNSF